VDNLTPGDGVGKRITVALETHLLTRALTVEKREVTDGVLPDV